MAVAAPPATNSAQALGNLQTFQSGMQSPTQVQQGAEQSLGVPQAQQQVSGLQQAIQNTTSLLSQVAPSVYGRTSGSLVTDAQATKQVANEQAPINANLNTENTQFNTENANLASLRSEADSRTNAELTGQGNQLSYLQNIYNDMFGQEKDTAQSNEAKREFDVSQANANKNAAADRALSASKSAAPKAADIQTSDQQTVAKWLQSQAGKDGYVSPESWKTAQKTWASYGYTASDFNTAFKNFANLTYQGAKRNYGL